MENMEIWKYIGQGLLGAIPLIISLFYWLVRDIGKKTDKSLHILDQIDDTLHKIDIIFNRHDEQAKDIKDAVELIKQTISELDTSDCSEAREKVEFLSNVVTHLEQLIIEIMKSQPPKDPPE